MGTIADDLAAARRLTVAKSDILGDGIPPLEIGELERTRAKPAAAVYARHSCAKQKSIPGQVALCRDRCEEKDWNVRYILKDKAKSATDPERDAFNRLVDLIEREAFDVLVVWKIDRIARSLAQAAVLNEFASEHGVALHSVTEPIDTTTPLGRFIFGILANAAQLELDMIRERTVMGIETRAREGRWPRPFVPFGYRRIRGNKLRKVDAEVGVVLEVVQDYVKMGSFAAAAAALNERGVRLAGRRVNAERVRSMVNNPLYRGRIEVGAAVAEAEHLRILSPALIADVEATRAANRLNGKPAEATARQQAINHVFDQYLAGLRRVDQ